MLYNCKKNIITIPLIKKFSLDVTTLHITKSCCGDKESILFCNVDKSNLLNMSLVVDNLIQIKEEPRLLCYIEMSWDEKINVDLGNVISFIGTKETYISNILTDTETLDISYFNTVHNIYTYVMDADRSYVFNLNFTLSNGITINYVLEYHTNVDYFSDSICSIINFGDNISYDYNCTSSFYIDENGINFNIDLLDGFYSISWEDISDCFVVECDETLTCKVKNFIEETFNKNCYSCNKKKDLETFMKLLMYYKALNSECLDCCARCNAYEKIINITKGCHDC